jgi:radical SAM superfamily enzyme YgiQ (UPF0313 family)
MDILLTHGYFLYEDETERRVMKPYPPLGILYISAYLKSKGFAVNVYDTTFKTKSAFSRYIETERPAIVGIYVNLMTKLNALELIRCCKRQGAAVIVGGPDVPEYAENYLRFGADVAVIGEGELTMEELIPALVRQQPLDSIAGIVYTNEDGQPIRTRPRELIHDLDKLPLPDRGAIAIADYVETWRKHHTMGSLSLICARGCPFTCTWCSRSVFGETHRRRSAKNVVDEIELILNTYHPDMLWFADDVFTINHKWFYEFYDEMKRRNIRIPFECISRADRLNEDILKRMAEIGSFRIWYGSESGSQRILDAMQRRVSVEEIRNITHIAQRFGIQAGLFVMLGYPGEEIADIEATTEHLKLTNADTFLTTVAYPIKGTEFYREVEHQLADGVGWTSASDRDLKIMGRHSQRFYWFANRYLVNEVLQHQQRRDKKTTFMKFTSTLAKSRLARIGMALTKNAIS